MEEQKVNSMTDKNGTALNIGDTIKSKNKLLGTIVKVNGVKKIIVRNEFGKITQSLPVREANLANMEKVEELAT